MRASRPESQSRPLFSQVMETITPPSPIGVRPEVRVLPEASARPVGAVAGARAPGSPSARAGASAAAADSGADGIPDGRASLVVVANRLPVRETNAGWVTSPGGLVSALMPVLRAQSGASAGGSAWIGWAGTQGDVIEPFDHEGVRNIPVAISADEFSGFYDGMSNRTLWPLFHDAVRPPIYRRAWYEAYEAVNRRFAEAAADAAARGALVWVHDYHLHLVPAMLRGLRPDVRIGFFLHIPFPGPGLFAQLPWRESITRGTLGADVVGFQTRRGARNFIDAARTHARAAPITGGVRFEGREVTVRAFPISIDTAAIERLARSAGVRERAAEYRRRVGGRKIMLGVDRMDYTKGIDVRLRAFRELLRSGRVSPDEVVLIQSGVPTRETVEEYTELRSVIEELVGQINGEFGRVGQSAVEYIRQNIDVEELVALYLAADVMLVTPLRDGMNLIAKEYVAARTDEGGVLMLSEFTGAAAELTRAIIVNPHDLDGVAAEMERALRMPAGEARRRQRALRRVVLGHDVHAWASEFLARCRP